MSGMPTLLSRCCKESSSVSCWRQKKKEIDQKHQNGGSMDGIYVNSVFIVRGGHAYSIGVILKNTCDSIAKSVVCVSGKGLCHLLNFRSAWMVALEELLQQFVSRSWEKQKNWNLTSGIEALQTFLYFIPPDFNNFLSFQIEVKFFQLPVNHHCIREVHPSYTRLPIATGPSQPPPLTSTSPVADLTTQV